LQSGDGFILSEKNAAIQWYRQTAISGSAFSFANQAMLTMQM
jgi:hypothetical protein